MRASIFWSAVVAGILLFGIVLLRTWPVINRVETGKTPEYPDIQPRSYRATREQVYEAAIQAVRRLPRWSLVGGEPGTGEVHAEAKSRVFKFVDDVRIRVARRDDTVLVEVTSASRVGRGDFGQNARNIRTFFGGLDQEMERTVGRR